MPRKRRTTRKVAAQMILCMIRHWDMLVELCILDGPKPPSHMIVASWAIARNR
jgi:hypothetical protein